MQTRHKTEQELTFLTQDGSTVKKNHYKCTKAICVDITTGLHAKHTKVRQSKQLKYSVLMFLKRLKMCITSVLELVTETMTLVYGAKKGHMLISVNQTSHLPQGKIRSETM